MTERFKPRAAVFAILRRGNTVLLQNRKNTGFFDGWYSLPGGHIEEGEPLREALVREIKEELCLEVTPEQLQFAHLLHRIGPGDTLQYFDMFFEVTDWTGEPVIGEPEKSDELRWTALDQLPEKTVADMRQVLEAVAAGQEYGEAGWDDR